MTVGEVRRLVGLLGVYRRHVKDFAKIAKPIYELLDGKNHKVKSPPTNGQLSSKHPINSVNLSPGFKNEFYRLQRGFRSFVNSAWISRGFAWILTSVSYEQLGHIAQVAQ